MVRKALFLSGGVCYTISEAQQWKESGILTQTEFIGMFWLALTPIITVTIGLGTVLWKLAKTLTELNLNFEFHSKTLKEHTEELDVHGKVIHKHEHEIEDLKRIANRPA